MELAVILLMSGDMGMGMWDVEHSGSTGRKSYMHIHIHSYRVHTYPNYIYIHICCRAYTAESADTRNTGMLRIAALFRWRTARDAESIIGRHTDGQNLGFPSENTSMEYGAHTE